jgi:branched-chain amino acid transport system ATP-binding protein
MTSPFPALAVSGISAGYNEAEILSNVSVEVLPGQILAVIGPNGSGKSTLAKVIAGLIAPNSGEVRLGAQAITGLKPFERVRAGISYVPQELNVFPNLTVRENLKIAEWATKEDQGSERDRVLQLFPEIQSKLRMRSGFLSGGERQLLAFACAMMANPKVLLLDEPSAGLSPKLTTMIMARIQEINATGVAIFMIEQNVAEALRIAQRVTMLVNGTVRLQASPAELRDKHKLQEIYLS